MKKTDSICHLVVTYFNGRNADKLYRITGMAFQKSLSANAFENLCVQNLFPLGDIKETVLINDSAGVNTYKAVFSSATVAFLLGLDKDDKIKTFLFKPFDESKEKKNYRVASTNPMSTALDHLVDSVVQPYISLQATTGLSIAVLKNNRTFFYGYGETAKGNKVIPDQNTIFEIGSITKTFTAILLAEAVNSGMANLNDPINKYLPANVPPLNYAGVPITLKTLSNHSSGLPGMPSNMRPADISNPYSDYDTSNLIDFYKNFKTIRQPGQKYEYSNLATGTLGYILEKLFKKNYETLIIEKICNPIGMKDTRINITMKDSSRFAKGYNPYGYYNPPWSFKVLAGAGAIRSTSSDLMKYAKANLGNAPESLKKAIMLTHQVTFNHVAKVGLGWHIIKPGKDELIFHNGETGSFTSYLAINLEKKMAVIILSNTSIGTEDAGDAIMIWLETGQ